MSDLAHDPLMFSTPLMGFQSIWHAYQAAKKVQRCAHGLVLRWHGVNSNPIPADDQARSRKKKEVEFLRKSKLAFENTVRSLIY